MPGSRRFWTIWLLATAAAHSFLAVWIASDARRRGASPTPWAIAAIPGGIFALLGWRKTRPPLA
ncbi:MAG: hypothetical protein ACR2J8_14180 [Thermomicrobiales bacterium]